MITVAISVPWYVCVCVCERERERCYLSGTGGIASSKTAYVWIPESTSSFVRSDTVFFAILEPASILVPETLVLWLT